MRHWNRSSGRYFHPTPSQTIACSAFYEAELLPNHNISTFNRLSNHYHRIAEACGTTIDVPGGGPIQSIEVGQIELTETVVSSRSHNGVRRPCG
jgi:hypothetical protein